MKPMALTIVIVNLLIFFIVGIDVLHSGIRTRDSDIIKVAYMNGYVAAIQLDIEDIKKLKQDEALLKEAVEKAADKYLTRVGGMNP